MTYKKASDLLPGDSVLFAEHGGGLVQVFEVEKAERICEGRMVELTIRANPITTVVRVVFKDSVVCVVEEYEWKD